ncbi:MAG: flavin reductase family protein [Candidatus Aenigmatarchaeota archaeon]
MKEKIKKAMKGKYPEDVALIITKDKKGVVDITPICYFMNASYKPHPETWAISLWKGHYSTENIKKTKEFVLCIPTLKQKKDILYCGSVSGKKVNKLEHCNFKTIPSKKIKSPMIKGCIACFECKVIKSMLVYNQMLFVGKIVRAKYFKKDKKVYHLGNYKLGGIR